MSLEFMVSIMFVWSKVDFVRGAMVFGQRSIRPAYIVWGFIGYMVTKAGQVGVMLAVVLSAHTYHFFSHVYPQLPSSKGRRLVVPPRLLERICDKLGLNNRPPFNMPDFDD